MDLGNGAKRSSQELTWQIGAVKTRKRGIFDDYSSWTSRMKGESTTRRHDRH